MEKEKDGEITKEEVVTPAADAPPVDPIKQELDKVNKGGRSEAEKAAFSLKKNAERARELGIDPAEVLGLSSKEEKEVDLDKPVTVGMLEEMRKSESQKTALQLADEEVSDENERELTKNYLINRIVPSGDAVKDLRDARALVNAVKTGQVLEEVGRDRGAKKHGSAPASPAKKADVAGELEASEMAFLKPPFNMKKEDIIKARQPQ